MAILFLEPSEHCHHLCTWINGVARIVLTEGHYLTCGIWCMCLPRVQCVCWFVFNPNWAAVNDLNSVWRSTLLCGTPVGTPNPLREPMTSQWSDICALLSLALFFNKFNSPKHDVIMASGSQATVRTCTDYQYNGINVPSFSSMCGRHNTLSLTDCNYESSCWVHYWASSALLACQVLMEQSNKKYRNWQNILQYR